jgi:choline dehydrogenase-like flavoprotein
LAALTPPVTRTLLVAANGKVHGIDNLYVADGSVLPRASRVNPALTIYAWGLRLGHWLIKEAHVWLTQN